jgi:hypothetical protein
MIITGNKFNFYVPDVTFLDILMGIFSYLDKSKSYSCNPTDYNRFFLRISKKYPNLFKDIYFKEDQFLPYSEEIERGYTLAMEFKIIRRPNPEIYPFMISASDEMLQKELEEKFTSEQGALLKEIAKEFEDELQIEES